MKKIITFITIFMIPVSIFAHSLLLNVFDNEDNTITVEGIFNTGESATGAYIILENMKTTEVLYKKRLPPSSELTIKIPNVKYNIILDGGPGHKVVKDGIAPIKGFKKENIEKNEKNIKKKEKKSREDSELSANPIVGISIALAFLTLFATILISIRNTNKILLKINNTCHDK